LKLESARIEPRIRWWSSGSSGLSEN
jgi:hypothetical protein